MSLRQRVREVVFAPASPVDLGAARILVAGTGLWMLLSRPGLVTTLQFPEGMWQMVSATQRLRFFYILPYGLEEILYLLAYVSLAAAALGVFSEVSCFVSAVLLYHFAPLETIYWTTNPYLRGFTIPVLALFVLAFSRSGDALALLSKVRRQIEPHSDYGWPLFLIRLFFAQIYFFAGYSKIFTSGIAWMDPQNIRNYLISINQVMGFPPDSLSYVLAASPLACSAMAVFGVGFDLLFPVAVVWPRARLPIVFLAFLYHVGNLVLFRIAFQNTILLLLFIDWSKLLLRRPRISSQQVIEHG